MGNKNRDRRSRFAAATRNLKGNRTARLNRDEIRRSDAERIEKLGESRSFRDYAEMRDLQEASLLSRAGNAAKAAWGAFNKGPEKPRMMLTQPGGSESDERFHGVELDMHDISDLLRKVRTPEIKRALEKFSIQVTNWFRDGAPPRQQQNRQQQNQQPQARPQQPQQSGANPVGQRPGQSPQVRY